MVHVTQHAVARYQERVSNLPDEKVRAALDIPAVALAAEIGAPFVKLGTGQHVVVWDHAVITVLPKDKHLGTMSRGRWVETQPRGYAA